MIESVMTENALTENALTENALLNTDGASRGNPGESAIGFTLKAKDNTGLGAELKTLSSGGACIGIDTNNGAEYRALIWGLQNAHALKIKKLTIQADSELLVKQLSDQYRVKSEGIKPLYREARQLLEGFETYSITHVPREENNEPDSLANQALDTNGTVGNFAVAYVADTLFLAAPKLFKKEGASMTKSNNGSYALTVKGHFDAAHALLGYPGECRELHGHTWDIEVTVRGYTLDEVGIVYDFKDLKNNLTSILDKYDHVYLNQVPPFDSINATAENLARVIYEQLETLLPDDIELLEVAVWESPIAKLTYSRQG